MESSRSDKKANVPVVSLCIPTNGVIQWVFPVLDSIFEQEVDDSLYEVIVMDNGNNEEFKRKMHKYISDKPNLIYRETDAYEFLSELEAYKASSGEFVKFINHRTKLLPGTLKYYIDFTRRNKQEKPVVYFANGAIEEEKKKIHVIHSFDQFVKRLSYWSSWSTGMAFWREDFEKITNLEHANVLFPHTAILFGIRDKDTYIIDNRKMLHEMPTGDIPKGRYNLFYAFAVEYPAIILDLLRDGAISVETFQYVKGKNFEYVAWLYYKYIIRKEKCSFDLSGSKDSFGIFYTKADILRLLAQKVLRRISRINRKKGK